MSFDNKSPEECETTLNFIQQTLAEIKERDAAVHQCHEALAEAAPTRSSSKNQLTMFKEIFHVMAESAPAEVESNIDSKLQHLSPKLQATCKALCLRHHRLWSREVPEVKTAALIPMKESVVPTTQRSGSANPEKQRLMQEEINGLLARGQIRKSASEWCSRAFLVPKKQPGQYRLVVDYRPVNSQMKGDAYCVPRIDVLLMRTYKSKFFTSLDIYKGYWALPLAEESMALTAFSGGTHGHYEFTRLPMGLACAPAIFQRLIDELLSDLEGVERYQDDILIHSECPDEHMRILSHVLERLDAAGWKLSDEKVHFCHEEIEFLGYRLGNGTIRPCQHNLDKILAANQPKNVTDIRSFLGLVGWYSDSIPNFAHIASPLQKLVKKAARFQWLDEQQQAFDRLRTILTDDITIRTLPNYEAARDGVPFVLSTDASNYGVGAILHQGGKMIACGSKRLNPAQCNYSATEKELLAIHVFVMKFRPYLECVKFKLETDHKPLQYILKKSEHLVGKQLRWVLDIQEFNFDITYRPGKDNEGPDFLSRYLPADEINPIHAEEIMTQDRAMQMAGNYVIGRAQRCDAMLSEIRRFKQNRTKVTLSPHNPWKAQLRNMYLRKDGCLYLHDKLLIVPLSARPMVLHWWHAQNDSEILPHLSKHAMKTEMEKRFFWPNMARDIRNVCETCRSCQAANRQPAQLPPRTVYQRGRFTHLQIDLLHMPRSGNARRPGWALVAIDVNTRFPFIESLSAPSGRAVALALHNRVFDMTGVYPTIQSDNGPEFNNDLDRALSELFGVTRRFSSPHHPQSNGIVERLNGRIKACVLRWGEVQGTSWANHLGQLRGHLRGLSLPHLGNLSPFEVVTGEPMRSRQSLAGFDSHATEPQPPVTTAGQFRETFEEIQSATQSAERVAQQSSDDQRIIRLLLWHERHRLPAVQATPGCEVVLKNEPPASRRAGTVLERHGRQCTVRFPGTLHDKTVSAGDLIVLRTATTLAFLSEHPDLTELPPENIDLWQEESVPPSQ